MSVTIGTQLGPYEITALLGKGGMGEVWRARDTKLKRDVAIKILPEAFSLDHERVNRFRAKPKFWDRSIIPISAQLTLTNCTVRHRLAIFSFRNGSM